MNQSLVGQILRSRYEIFKLIGAGGFGDTYLAYDCDLPGKPKRVVKHLAPKALDPKDFHLAERLFKQEAELLYKLGEQHDQIPFLYAYFQEEGQFYLVQEFIEGHDLTHEIPPGKKLGEGETLELLDEILSVLSFVHENGVIHRDIKPQNIMRRERDGKLFLIDFGAVKEINVMTTDGTGQTSLTVGIGSPGFMPSEQAAGRPKLSSDVYAVGMIGLNCLTGVQPSQLNEDRQTGELMWQHLAQVRERTSQFLQTMVRDHFSQRFETATVAHSALTSLVKGGHQTEPSVDEEKPIPPTIRYEPTSPPVEPTIKHEKPPVKPVSPNKPIQPEVDQPHQSRRGFLTLLGLGGMGLGGALLYGVTRNGSITESAPTVDGSDLSQKEFPTVDPDNLTFPTVDPDNLTNGPDLSQKEFPTVDPGNLGTLSGRNYYVVTNYTDETSFAAAKQIVPEAQVVNFTAGTRIQLKQFSNEADAREAAAQLRRQGLNIEILASPTE